MKRLHDILVRILAVSPEQITDTLSPESVESWDSFNGLLLVSELESVFGVKFTMAEVVAVKNVADIKSALARHGVVLVES